LAKVKNNPLGYKHPFGREREKDTLGEKET